MRPAPLLIAAASAALLAGSVLAAGSPSSASSPASPHSSPATPPAAATGAGADTSATAGGFSVGMPVKDNTGVTIGSIANLTTDASGKPAAVIKMGSDQFQVAVANLGAADGAATINLTQAQIANMLHGSAGAAASGGASGGAAPAGHSTPKP